MQTITREPPERDPADLSDDELGVLALAADPDAEVPADAVPLDDLLGTARPNLLPGWYMTAPMSGARVLRGWRRQVIYVVIAAFLTITAFGLCNTYGQLHLQ
jgi:hypothetical protein